VLLSIAIASRRRKRATTPAHLVAGLTTQSERLWSIDTALSGGRTLNFWRHGEGSSGPDDCAEEGM